jgi:hypothetical protein
LDGFEEGDRPLPPDDLAQLADVVQEISLFLPYPSSTIMETLLHHERYLRSQMTLGNVRTESICDLFGAMATVAAVRSLGIPLPVGMAACALALHNLTVLQCLDDLTAATPDQADNDLQQSLTRQSVTFGATRVSLSRGYKKVGKDPTAVIGETAFKMAGVSRLYHRLRRVLLSTEWASLPDRLLSDPIRLANAVAVLTMTTWT